MVITYINARCHCAANQFRIPFPTSSLPIVSDLCHCNACRHTTGAMALHTVPMHGFPLSRDPTVDAQHADLSNLSKYKVTPHLNRYFCARCGAYMLFETAPNAPQSNQHQWSVSSGCLERTEGVTVVGCHTFLGDTLDGGLADLYRMQGGVIIPRYEKERGGTTLPLGWKADRLVRKLASPRPIGIADESLSAFCHCRTITLSLKRPMVPQQWWHFSQGSDPIRFRRGYCVCNDCRFSSGSIISPWMFTLRENVFDGATGQPITLTPSTNGFDAGPRRPVGLERYESSRGVFREFCGKCGATIFFYRMDREGGELLNVALGLLNEEQDGSRAERWCKTYNVVSHSSHANDKGVSEILQNGLMAHLSSSRVEGN